ncbi:uncharacterized protein LOC660584 [Tribolium castaneum]|uniref:uncharacterized protein LOC660584 n=1 Tax=Tribolium castaneum TaxID=7070 RepID=UPI0030FF1E05
MNVALNCATPEMSTSSGNSESPSAANVAVKTVKAPPELSYEKCPRCRIQFDYIKRVDTTKVPLILPCKHTVCEDCIRRLCVLNNTACPICKEAFTAPKGKVDKFHELFPPHFALIGHLLWEKNRPHGRKQFNFVSTGVTGGQKPPDLSDFDFDDIQSDTDESLAEFTFDKCKEHPTQLINIQCEQCEDLYCSYCFLDYHNGHTSKRLCKLSQEEIENLNKFKYDMEVILGQLLSSRKKVKDLEKLDSKDLEYEIQNYFYGLHAKLHFAEFSLKKRLPEMKPGVADLHVVNETLNASISRITQILKYCELVDSMQLNVKALYEEVQNVRNLPCRLVSDQGALRPIEFQAESLFDDIEESVTLRTINTIEYSLLPIDDWSCAEEKYMLEAIRRKSESTISDVDTKKESVEDIHSSSHYAEREVLKKPERKPTQAVIRVVVTHINDLNSFYIQKYTALDSLRTINNIIGKRISQKIPENEFRIGAVYGVLYVTKNASRWRRGRLLEIYNTGTERLYKVYFVDYGNTQKVTADKFKHLDVRTMKRPSWAQECKLTNPDNTEFDANAHLELSKIIDDKELYVHYVSDKQNRGPVEVDLYVSTSSGGLVSVRDLLAKNVHPVYEIKSNILASNLQFFENSKQFSVGQEETVVVTHVRDPFHICVQLVENCVFIERLKMEMEKFYKDQPTISCIPSEGSNVVIRHVDKTHGNWHRAKIMAVDIGKKTVEVYFVDWGKYIVVPWSEIRQLDEDFIKMECQGIIVKLADVGKLETAPTWTSDAISFLRKNIAEDDRLRMVVSKTQPLEVVLFHPRPAADICVNSLLVEENHAMSTGNLSMTVYWPNSLDEQCEDDDFASQMVKKAEDILMENEDDIHLVSGLRVNVKVLRCESPDLIYVKLLKHKEEDDEMHKELQIHYGGSRKTKNKWRKDDLCVVFDPLRHTYYRAMIRSPTKNDVFTVWLYDHARELKVPKAMVFVQDSYFKKARCFVWKCRLTNVKPAGDPGKWSNMANEMLEKIFHKYKTIYVKKIESNRELKLVGVAMWYCLTTPAMALEPAKVRYISINQALIESGVAFSVGSGRNVVEQKEEIESESSSESEVEVEVKQKTDWNDIMCEEDELMITEQKTWPPLLKPDCECFEAFLVCIDSEGALSVRDDMLQSSYYDLEEKITSKMNSMEPSQGVTWAVGDMCSIRWEQRWYRGTILEVAGSDEFCVEMIDFGSEHNVTGDKLTKYLLCPDVPPLLYKIKLYDVWSNFGDWTPEDLNVWLSIVTDNIKVVIKDWSGDFPLGEIYVDNGLSLNDLIVQRCPHAVRHQSQAVLQNPDFEAEESEEKEEEDEDTSLKYFYVPLKSTTSDKVKMYVLNVFKFNSKLEVVLSKDKVEDNSELLMLNADIEEGIDDQALMQEFKLNKPCVCLCPEKDQWLRAFVYGVDELHSGYVRVFFVDYGDIKMVPTSSVKETRTEWLNVPVKTRIAAVNIEIAQNSQADFVLLSLKNLCGKLISVKILAENPLRVHLYEKKKLCYQNILDIGYAKML